MQAKESNTSPEMIEELGRLKRENTRLKHIMKASFVEIWDWPNVREENIYLSDEFIKSLGYESDNFKFSITNFMSLIHPSDLQVVNEVLTYHLSELDQPFSMEFRLRDANGNYLWFLSKGTTQWNEKKGKKRMMGSLLNVNKLKTTEKEIHDVNEELQQFAYSLAHDLRAPVRHIGMYAEILEEDSGAKLNEEELEHLQIILHATDKMAQMIDELLNYTKNRSQVLKIEWVDTSNLVDRIITLLKVDLIDQDQEVEWKIGELPEVRADEMALWHVFQNLISNALKYAKEEEKTVIEITSENLPIAHQFTIKDNGIGFDMRFKNKLFKVFQRLHKGKEYKGTGIGLASARRNIEKHGGTIWAEGEIGIGASFSFTLPK